MLSIEAGIAVDLWRAEIYICLQNILSLRCFIDSGTLHSLLKDGYRPEQCEEEKNEIDRRRLRKEPVNRLEGTGSVLSYRWIRCVYISPGSVPKLIPTDRFFLGTSPSHCFVLVPVMFVATILNYPLVISGFEMFPVKPSFYGRQQSFRRLGPAR